MTPFQTVLKDVYHNALVSFVKKQLLMSPFET